MKAARSLDLEPSWLRSANDNARVVGNFVRLFPTTLTEDTDRRQTMEIAPQIAGSSTRVPTQTVYDANGRVTAKNLGTVTDAAGSNLTIMHPTSYQYDPCSSQLSTRRHRTP